ncbi:hypothetical protein DPMN_035511 [Dreissena polymorpha]|uniref:Uncharacterized protein n=1 Tax=Dreissena polymorpha TaxID=45954 RepID=A0A9D4RKN3_DREPO|nr:hypothetical protein DPMN_035511 [Dreissena polymorpha]
MPHNFKIFFLFIWLCVWYCPSCFANKLHFMATSEDHISREPMKRKQDDNLAIVQGTNENIATEIN